MKLKSLWPVGASRLVRRLSFGAGSLHLLEFPEAKRQKRCPGDQRRETAKRKFSFYDLNLERPHPPVTPIHPQSLRGVVGPVKLDGVRMRIDHPGAILIKNDPHLVLPAHVAGIEPPSADQIVAAWGVGLVTIAIRHN